MSRRLALTLAACGALTAIAAPSIASAQASRGASESNWRRHGTKGTPPDSPLTSFTFETRFGAYYPEIDEEFGGPGPYAEYFGSSAQFYFGLELDWTPIRIPYIGRLGPAFGWGFTTMNAQAKIEPTTVEPTTDETEDGESAAGPSTTISIHAMHVSAVLRIDEISRRTVLPIVPYGKFGLGFGAWSSSTSTGTSQVGSDCDAAAPTSCFKGEGLSIGPHIAVGGMLGLNWLDPRSGAMARETTGIDQAYLFGEWMWANLDSGVGKPGMHIGTSSWVVGIALDL